MLPVARITKRLRTRWDTLHLRVVILGLFLATLAIGCTPTPTPPLGCVDFESPLILGTQYGTPAGQTPGTLVFTSNNIPVTVWDFKFTSGGGTFNLARIENAPVTFGSGQSIHTNNINLEFAFAAVSQIQFEFLDLGGFENISVNGSPIFPGELSAAPSPIGGVSLTVTTTPVTGAKKGTVTLKGTIDRLRVGGQEFWIDNVCAWK